MPAAVRGDGVPSVAISTRDRPEALARCLDALATGNLPPREIVVVDQSRTAATRTVVEERRAVGLPIRWISQEPRGLGTSQNAAVRAATGAVVAVTDDDCVPDPGWLATIARIFAEPDAPDVLAGRVLPLPPEGDRLYPVSSRLSTKRRDFQDRAVPWHLGSGNNFALRRTWFLRIGGCDERLGPGSAARGGVDMDLFYRLLRAGARARYEPDVLVFHERQTLAERAGRRPMYGRGMGACFALWFSQGDAYALPVLGRWLLLRTARMGRAVGSRDWMGVREEATMLRTTVDGVLHGWRVRNVTPGL